MCYPSHELTELQHADLRPFLPALRHADKLFARELARCRRQVEAQGWAVARRNRRELSYLRELIRDGAEAE